MSRSKRWTSLFRSRRLEQDLEDELRAHVEMRAEDNVAAGMPQAEAQREAALLFGNRSVMKEDTRAMYVLAWMESLLQDLKFGWRTLRRSPTFSLVAILTVALNIGATTAVFTIVRSVLLRPLPYGDPDRLVYVTALDPLNFLPLTPGVIFSAWHGQPGPLTNIAAYNSDALTFTGTGEPERITAADVTADFLPTLGIAPRLGRNFSEAEAQPGGDHVAILSYRLWQQQFYGDPKVLGQKFKLEGELYEVIGVMPHDFRFPDNSLQPALLVPLQNQLSSTESMILVNVVGRLGRGVTQQQAWADLTRIARQAVTQLPANRQGFLKDEKIEIAPLQAQLVGDVRKPLLIILAAVGFVLLIGCLNIASLQLARAVDRTAEMDIRSALGAQRNRLTRQLLTENILLYSLGSAVGYALAWVAVQMVNRSKLAALPAVASIAVDRQVLAFAAFITLACAILFGLVPASWLNQWRLIRHSTSRRFTLGRAHRRLRKLLLVSEVALALVLLAGAGLMIHSFNRLLSVDPGFNPSRVLTAHISLMERDYPRMDQQTAFFHRLLEQVQAIPGVDSAAISAQAPLLGDTGMTLMGIRVEGQPAPPKGTPAPLISVLDVSADYFRTMGITILAGRSFNEGDNGSSVRVVMVNQAFVRKFFGRESALGKRLLSPSPKIPPETIIGVVGDVCERGLDQEAGPEIYESPFATPFPLFNMVIVIRSRLDPAALTTALRNEVKNIDRNQALYDVATMDRVVYESLQRQRLSLMLISAFAGLALALAAVGIFGVMSYSVAQRSQEIGIRMALGSTHGRIMRSVLREAMWITLVGVIFGLGGALGLTRFISSWLFNIKFSDPITMVSASALLVAVGLLAGAVPAYRASRVDPMRALRAE